MELEIGTSVTFTFNDREYYGKIIGYDRIRLPREDSDLSDSVPCYVIADRHMNYLVSERIYVRRAIEPNDIEYYFKGVV